MKKTPRCLIAVDMDGTLLNSKSKVSFWSKRYLRKLDKQGHIVVLASGRPARALKYFYNQIGLTGPIICYNGAHVFHPNDENFPTTSFNFPVQFVKDVYYEVGTDICTNCMCETDSQIWLINKDEQLNRFFWHVDMDIIYGDLKETLDKDPWTFILQLKDRDHNHIIKKAVEKHPGYSVRFWTTYAYAEVYNSQTSKAACIEQIAKYYGIPKEHTIGIGDASNDIEMLEHCGVGIAMKNGNKYVKAIAKYISKKDNDHNGAIHAIKDVLKKLSQ